MMKLRILVFLACCSYAAWSEKMPEREHVLKVMERVADWQIENPHPRESKKPLAWTSATWYAGLFEFAQMKDDPKYIEYLRGIGSEHQWGMNRWAPYHADNHCIGQMYLEMFRTYAEPDMKMKIQERFDWILEHRATTGLVAEKGNSSRWNWCDALFMAPPVWAKMYAVTGNEDYLSFMDEEFRSTTAYLYDPEAHLYFRDSNFFGKKSKNGEKVFWSRGNGWVFGGLTLVMRELPEDSAMRPFYEKIFKEMAAALEPLQGDDGFWRASLLDPDEIPEPESSGTAFFTYGFAWGINNGLLDRSEYLSAVSNGWKALESAVHANGKMGWVQQIGHDPRPTSADETQVYGVGAFLFAGSEILKLME